MRAEHEKSQSIYRYPDGGVIRLEHKKEAKVYVIQSIRDTECIIRGKEK